MVLFFWKVYFTFCLEKNQPKNLHMLRCNINVKIQNLKDLKSEMNVIKYCLKNKKKNVIGPMFCNGHRSGTAILRTITIVLSRAQSCISPVNHRNHISHLSRLVLKTLRTPCSTYRAEFHKV